MFARHRMVLVAPLLALLAAPAFSADKPAPPPPKPSFDCTKAKGRVKLMICGDAELAVLDVQEDQLLHRARVRSAQPEAVNAEEDVWLGERDACSTAPCIARAYRRRLEELHRWTN